MKKIGFTSSFPVEVVIAAGHKAIDLNNIFVTGNAKEYVEDAEFFGYPRNVCSWIKGMYSVALESNIDSLVGIVQGDCSNTHSLMSSLKDKKIDIIPFSFPYEYNDTKFLKNEISKLEEYFKVSHKKVIETKKWLDNIRKKLILVDDLTWKDSKVTGFENHFWLVNSSDFMGDPVVFEKKLDEFLLEAEEREPKKFDFNFAYIGVPPIITDLYDFLAEMDINVTFNEVQRQFSMPYLAETIEEQYGKFTYPYSVENRIPDLNKEISKRKIDGVISYSQAFCHKQIDQILLKKYIDSPFLVIEGDQPEKLDARTKLRIESFVDMLTY